LELNVTSVSVIIPVHNRVDFIPRVLDSVYQQSRLPDEIIVVDDGSSDATQEMILKSYPDVNYVFQDNTGVSSARNRGIRLARGNWLAFLDSDDEWLPEKLEKQIAAIEKNRSIYIFHSDEVWIRNGKRINQQVKHKKQGGHIFQNCLPLCVISPSSVIIHRSIFDTVGLFDTTLPACEDYDMWLRICARYEVQYLEEPLVVKHGGHADQLSLRYWGMDRFRIQALEKIVESNILNNADQQAAIDMLIYKIDIFANGANKRGNDDVVLIYQLKKEKYLNPLTLQNSQ